ncbi:MAG TPA: hypothetical protein PK328_15900, partial [Chitinophagaceae bacterium]|nr:hypothetical protein [Chitinophagaceae bacterium]
GKPLFYFFYLHPELLITKQNKMKSLHRYLTMAGGALIIIALFLPFTELLGQSVSGLKLQGATKFYLILGAGMIVLGYLDKKKSYYYAALIVGVLVILLSMKYQSDVKKFSTVGMGLWVLLLSGVITLAGGITGIRSKKEVTT